MSRGGEGGDVWAMSGADFSQRSKFLHIFAFPWIFAKDMLVNGHFDTIEFPGDSPI